MEPLKTKNVESFKITGNWDDHSKKLRNEFSQLTDSDLKLETGKEDELLKRVQSRLHKGRAEVIKIIDQAGKSNAN
jgi:uncharacterized protein YjbJ (UPF0337 family)